jgi:hypothetical protein
MLITMSVALAPHTYCYMCFQARINLRKKPDIPSRRRFELGRTTEILPSAMNHFLLNTLNYFQLGAPKSDLKVAKDAVCRKCRRKRRKI